jgi:hypothetical protein
MKYFAPAASNSKKQALYIKNPKKILPCRPSYLADVH